MRVARFDESAIDARRSGTFRTSIPLNVAEASGRTGKDRSHHFRIAYGSAQETTVAVQLLRSVGVVSLADEAALLPLLERVKAMTWRLAGR